MKELDLSNNVSVITGGTSGIGCAIAESFFQHNSDVVIIGRDAVRGERAVINISDKDRKKKNLIKQKTTYPKSNDMIGPTVNKENRILFLPCDIGNRDEIKNICSEILKEFKKVDILVLNAGIEFTESIIEVKPEHWQKMLDVNISGAFYFFRYLADSMITNNKGNVIILSSTATRTGAGGGIHYATTKAALNGMMARINYELLSKGIRANIISPGIVDTPMLRKKYPDNEEINKKLCEQVPMGKIARPEDIANLALFLASDMSDYICGQDIIIDGGRLYYKRPPITVQVSRQG